jgi:hypothetical protein
MQGPSLRARATRAGLAAALATSLFAARATASDPPEAVRIVYAAPASCPDRDVLFAHVQARTARARAAAPGESARELIVSVEESEGRFSGRLVIPSSHERVRQQREVTDAGCDALIEALGFFIALSIDPNATAAPVRPSPAPVADAGVAPEPHLGPSAVAPLAPTPQPTPTLLEPPTAELRRSVAVSDREDKPRWGIGGGTGVMVVSGLAPKLLLGNRVFLDVRRSASGKSLFAPLASLAAVSTATGTGPTSDGEIALRWQALVGTVCPLSIPLVEAVALRPCSLLEVGRLRGDGVGVRNAQRNDAGFVAVGFSGRAEFRVSSKLSIELEVGGSAPVARPRFNYSSGEVVFDTPAFGARTALMVAVRP